MTEPLALHTGTLYKEDVKKHLENTFFCPAGTQGLELTLTFTPAAAGGIRNMICVSVFSPEGFRGSGHRHGSEHRVLLSEAAATPGYFPGPLPAGEWRVVLHTHMVMSGEALRYRLEVRPVEPSTVEPPPVESPVTQLQPFPPTTAGWYKGDLHAHSTHSDAAWTVSQLTRAAAENGLDFVTLSDHNTVSGLPEMEALSSPDLLTLGGTELTTFYGHALALGRRGWLDWIGTEMPELAAQADEDGLYIIAHPRREGDPVCTGCRWEYPLLMPGRAQVVEIWNGGAWGPHNEEALALWYSWLAAGHRLSASAGTDAHRAAAAGTAVGYNVVYAEALTEAAILAAVRRGRSYLSSGPKLELTRPGVAAPVTGDVAELPVTLSLRYADVPDGAVLRFITNGDVRQEHPLSGEGRLELPVEGAVLWGVLELRDAHGAMLAVTNPVFTTLF